MGYPYRSWIRKKASISEFVYENCNEESYHLISTYKRRDVTNDRFTSLIDQLSEAVLPLKTNNLNVAYVPGWIQTMIVAVYFWKISPLITDPSSPITTGSFVASLNVMKGISAAFTGGYTNYQKIKTVDGPLKVILSSDLP